MSSASLTVKQKLANGFVIFTAIWSSAIMPVIPSYAKMLDNNDLPSLASEHNVTEDNTERLVAEYSKTLGTFLSQNKNSQDLSDKAINYARNKVANEATKEIENWLSKAGNARLNIDIDKNFSIKNSQLDWLIPWYDQPQALLFTQHSIHRSDERLHVNNGIGLRRFNEKNTIGINAFIDHDISRAHTRAGLGAEYWQDYLKLNANGYLGLTSWKSAPELNHDYNAKPAHGWDIQVESWLPTYPQLGGNLKYEQYYGDSVALFGKTKRQRNPSAATIGAHWTPFPLFTLNANHKFSSPNQSETQAKLQFTWIFGKSLAHHLDPTKVAEARRLSGNRYDFVERNNSIILDYQKKTLLRLSLPAKIQGEAGLSVSLVKSFTSKYPLKHIEWNAPELLVAGGSISSIDQTAVLILPSYKTANTAQDAQKANRYRLRATAYDIKGNASPVAETLVEVTHSGVLSINPRDITFYGAGLANGNDINGLTAIVRDSHGNAAPNAKVVFVLPNTLSLVTQKTNTATPASSNIQHDLRKKMQAMKVAKPLEYTTTTNAKGEAQVQFTSQIAGAYEISVYTGNHPPVKTQVTFIPDVAGAYIHNFTVSRSGVIADGVSTHSISALIMDKNKNPIPNYDVNFSATNAKIVDKAKTDENGLVEVTLTSVKAGASEVTLSINGQSETKAVEFISGQAHQIAVLEVPEVYAGRESRVLFQLLDNQDNPIIDAKDDVTIIIDKKASSTPIWDIDIDNGIYAANISGQQSGEHTIQVVMDKLTSPERTFTTLGASSIKSTTADGSGVAGTLGVIASIEINITPDQTSFKSGDSPLIIVTLKDSFGNEIENVDFNHIHLGDLKGKDLAWRDEGHSDYVVNLPLTSVGNIDITANVNGIFSPKTVLTVSHNNGISSIDHVVVTPTNTSSNAGDKPTLKVELTDSSGNTVNDVKQVDVTIDGQTQTRPVTQNPDGSYTVELPAQHSGSKDIQVSVNGKDSNQATLIVQAPTSTVANTSGNAGEQGVLATVELTAGSLANLKSGDTLALTVTAKDSFKNPLTGLVAAIILTHAQTGSVTWSDNQDGTYTASLALSKLGNDTLTTTVNAVSSNPMSLTVNNAAGNTHIQNVVVTPTNPSPNAGDKPTLKIELTDSHGNTINDVKQVEVTIDGQQQTLPVTQNPDGSYTVELPAQHSGSKDIQVSVNGKDSNNTTLTVQAPTPTPTNTSGNAGEQGVLATVELTTGSLANLKSGDTLALTVTAKDSFKNPLTGLAAAITLSHNQAGTVTWVDNQDGTYSGVLTLTKLGNDSLNATVNTISASPITLNVDNAASNTHIQNVVVTLNNPSPNAGDKPTLKVELTDSNGNTVNEVKQLEITIDGQKQTLPVTQNPDGSYTVELPAQHSGSKNIQVTVNGKDSNNATLTVQAPQPTPAKANGNTGEQGVLATVELTAGSLANLKSGDTLTLTVTAQDTFKNPLTGLASAITLSHNQAGTVTWVDNQDGTYSGTLTLTKLGNDTLNATVNAIASQPTSITVNPQQGKASVTAVELHAQPPIITAGQSTTLTLTLRDKHDNGVVQIPSNDIKLEDNKLALSNIQWQEQGNGVYTTSIMFSEVRTHSLTAGIGQFTEATNVIVNSPTGKDAVKAIAIAPVTNSDAGQPSSLSIDLTDQYKNPVKNVYNSDITVTINGQKQNIIFIENNASNKYTAQLPASKANRYKIVVEVNGQSETTEWVVNSPIAIPISSYTQDGLRGSLETISITHNAKNHTVNSGDKVTLSVELKDKFDNQLTGAAGSLKLLTNLQSASAWKELSSGLYTQELTMDKLNKQSIEVKADKMLSNKLELDIVQVKGANHVHKTTLETNVNAIEAGKEVILTLTLTDTVNNGVIGVDTNDIQLSNNGKPTVATWAHSQDGVYTTKMRLDTVGNYQFKASVNNQSTPIKTVDVTAPRGANVVSTAQITANADAFDAGEKTELTLVLKDQYGNLVTDVNGADITLKDSHTSETFDSSKIVWQMASIGEYKAVLPVTKVGKHTLTATINKQSVDTNEITVKALKGTSHVKKVELITTETSIKAGESTELTLTLLDSYGNEVADIMPSDIKLKNSDNAITTTASWVKTPSHESVYTANITLEKVKQHTLSVDVGNQTKNIEIEVKPLEGTNHIASVALNMPVAARLGANTPLILQLKDKFGNGVTHVASQDIQLTNNGQVENTSWNEGLQGQYTANWLSTKVGKHQLDVIVNTNRLVKPIDIELMAPKGAEHIDNIKIDMLDTTNTGDIVKVTLKLQDKYGLDVLDVSPSDITLSSDKQALSSLVWRDDKHGNYSTDVTFDKAGKHTLTVTISNSAKTAAKRELTIKALPPVFGNGKSEFSIDTDSVEGNGKDKATITLKLIDRNNSPISGINPTLTISNGALGNMVMKETSTSGVYSAAISNPNESKVIVTLDPNSIGYVGAKQEIDIYFYSFQDIHYPLNSVIYQQFIKFGYQNDDYSGYTWENGYPDVIGINSTSSLYIKGRPKPQENVITLIARPKKNSHLLKAIRATITINKFIHSSNDKTDDQHSTEQLCKNKGSRLATADEIKGLYKTPSGTLNLLLPTIEAHQYRHWVDSASGFIYDDKFNYPVLGATNGLSLPAICTVDY